jgi:hypothetical protein
MSKKISYQAQQSCHQLTKFFTQDAEAEQEEE